MSIKLAISGARGKMGTRIAFFAFQDPDIEVVSALEDSGHPDIGKDLGELVVGEEKGVIIEEDPYKAIEKADVLVEFSTPDATLQHLDIAVKLRKKAVVGTTGLDTDMEKIKKMAENTAILVSPNMSIGVNVLLKVLPDLVRFLGGDYDIEIIELHHKRKKDAPSGTALRLAQAIKQVRTELKEIYGRRGVTGPRREEELGIHALRLGDVVGEHRVIFAGNEERIELIHTAGSRDIFARGALRAVKYIRDKKRGFYTMDNVLEAGV
ncbi:MAG: 4-hydroxy-tetrahydrodipicolinate reductase [Candidatus Omnitrophica bacterium 4484_49]|nr:MAG: 4-hydroxy-tetrahydrodipicolinate reductase [Candidatus Omnitrophica bacterium 4484_49]